MTLTVVEDAWSPVSELGLAVQIENRDNTAPNANWVACTWEAEWQGKGTTDPVVAPKEPEPVELKCWKPLTSSASLAVDELVLERAAGPP